LPAFLFRRALPLLVLATSFVLIPFGGSTAAATREIASGPSTEALLADFGFDAAERGDVNAGEIVVIDVETVQRNELAEAAAMRLAVPPADLADRIRRGLLILADGERRAHAQIDADDADQVWLPARLGDGDDAEVARLFDIEPGDRFNFSGSEIATIRRWLGGPAAQSSRKAQLASTIWRDILKARYAAYRAEGQRGLADYDRGDSLSSPADQLHRMASAAVPKPVVPLARALDLYPAGQPSWLESFFYWKKSEADGRPVFVLSHVLVGEADGATLFALREYYAGHSYNVLEQLGIAVPYDGGSLVLIVNRTVTDRIGGPLGIVARPIGRLQARQAVRDYFSGIREGSSRPLP